MKQAKRQWLARFHVAVWIGVWPPATTPRCRVAVVPGELDGLGGWRYLFQNASTAFSRRRFSVVT